MQAGKAEKQDHVSCCWSDHLSMTNQVRTRQCSVNAVHSVHTQPYATVAGQTSSHKQGFVISAAMTDANNHRLLA